MNIHGYLEKLGSKINKNMKEKIENVVRTLTDTHVNAKYTEVGRYRNGDSFGKLALIDDTRRVCTVRCVKPSFFATLSVEDFKASIGKIQRMLMDNLSQFLNDCPSFGGDPTIKKNRKAIRNQPNWTR